MNQKYYSTVNVLYYSKTENIISLSIAIIIS